MVNTRLPLLHLEMSSSPDLQTVENDVPKGLVDRNVVEGLLGEAQGAGAEGQGLQVVVLSQFQPIQPLVDESQAVVGHPLAQTLTCWPASTGETRTWCRSSSST